MDHNSSEVGFKGIVTDSATRAKQSITFRLTFLDASRLEGSGHDEIGDFSVAGSYSDTGEISFIARHANGCCVRRFTGIRDPDASPGTVVGKWMCEDGTNGDFSGVAVPIALLSYFPAQASQF